MTVRCTCFDNITPAGIERFENRLVSQDEFQPLYQLPFAEIQKFESIAMKAQFESSCTHFNPAHIKALNMASGLRL